MVYAKPLPQVDAANREFWDAAREHRFLLYRCESCRTYYYPVMDCTTCDDIEPPMRWVEASGRANLFTWIVMHRPYHEGFRDDVPYNVALVKLDEGPFFLTNIVDCKDGDLKEGTPMEVHFDDVTEEVTLPKFRPATR